MQLHGFFQDLHQGNDIVTIYLHKDKGLFDELATTNQSISLVDFNVYVFLGLRNKFHDSVTSLLTKVEHFLYSKFYNPFLTHEFLHKSSF